MRNMVNVKDILSFLVGRSAAPSSFGAQLDRLRYGLHSTPDPLRTRSEIEDQLLNDAVVIRCIDRFMERENFQIGTNIRNEPQFKLLNKVRQQLTDYTHGHIALGILRAFHERGTRSEEMGLVAVYSYLRSIAPGCTPPLPKDTSDILQAFRAGEAKRARSFAAEAYADATLALDHHVRIFNKNEAKKK